MNDQARRIAFLDEMGLGPVWAHKSRLHQGPAPEMLDAAEVINPGIEATSLASPSEVEIPQSAWDDKHAIVQAGKQPTSPLDARIASDKTTSTTDIAQMSWSQLQAGVSGCTRCDLCKTRSQTVFGVGDQQAKWLFVGEGPGRNEDVQGLPFVGPAGKLLDNMLLAMGLRRGENVYIANTVKCRPTDVSKRDRPPAADEIDACMPYLERQIALINPTVIVALGKTAALSLLKLDPATPVGKLRGIVHRYADYPLIVTYHPAYLLRTPSDKSKAWADLCLAMQSHANDAGGLQTEH